MMAFLTPFTPSLRQTSFTPRITSYPPPKSHQCFHRAVIRAQGGPKRSTVADTPRKIFLDRLKALGKVRMVGRNEAAIMESIATFDGLFFATIPSGEYANIVDMSINLDMHLLLSGISGARFEVGVSRSASRAPTYIIRVLGKDKKAVVLSLFLQWERDPSDISAERTQAWEKMKQDYCKDGDVFYFDS